jgi:S1-C subfamily serine protease
LKRIPPGFPGSMVGPTETAPLRGAPVAFPRIYGVRAGSVSDQVGLRNGDEILAVNGIPMTGPAGALEAYAALGGSKGRTVLLVIRRQGTIYRIQVNLAGVLAPHADLDPRRECIQKRITENPALTL